MSVIIIAGLSEGQKVYLCRSRPIEGEMKLGEYLHSSKEWKPLAYRKNLPTEVNGSPKAIEGVTLHRIIAKEWDNKNGKSWSFSLVISNGSGSHRIDLGGGMIATSVVNSFLSLLGKSKEEIEQTKFRLAFYHNKGTGFNSCSIQDHNGDRLNWYMSPDEVKSYIKSAPNPLKPDETLTDKSPLMLHYMELCDALNPMLPRSNASTGSALDGIDDDLDEYSSESTRKSWANDTNTPKQSVVTDEELDDMFGATTDTPEPETKPQASFEV